MGGSSSPISQNTTCHSRLGVPRLSVLKYTDLADPSGLRGHPHCGIHFNIHIDLKSKNKSEEKEGRVGKTVSGWRNFSEAW